MKLKLVKSIVLLGLTSILFISTLYAWYISNTTVGANNITGSIIEAEGGGVEILESSIADNPYSLYPYQDITFKLKATRNIKNLVVEFDVTMLEEAEYKNAFTNHPEYTTANYQMKINEHFYSYEPSNKVDMLWQMASLNNIADYFTGRIAFENRIIPLESRDSLYSFNGIEAHAGDIFMLNIMLGNFENEKYPQIDYENYSILAQNFNCYMLGTSVKLFFTVEGK